MYHSQLKQYTVYFSIQNTKLKITVDAYDAEHAKNKVKGMLSIDKVVCNSSDPITDFFNNKIFK